ncbi:hypothetical protein C9E81_04335 [Paracoccus alkanivorans]|uniref:Uncharacterized protein n=1 Tax=Paracoccus alkanivorans TaxID=2116655 RepID=A0A3M0MNQ1_9RHOB|nr:hypothetical protein C9E81_04335 [Paracoccus alkanivorans]
MLRDALRIVRHVAREGRDVVQHNTSKAGRPVEQIAGAAIAQVDRFAHGAEEVAHLMLGESGKVCLPATALQAGALNASAFAHAAYAALGHILRNLGAHSWLVSEVKSARAFESVRGTGDIERATALAISMRDHGAIAEARMDAGVPLAGQEAAQLAYFGLMLWMLADKSSDDAQEVLDAATALSLALRDDILNAQGDREAIAALLKEFRDHV